MKNSMVYVSQIKPLLSKNAGAIADQMNKTHS